MIIYLIHNSTHNQYIKNVSLKLNQIKLYSTDSYNTSAVTDIIDKDKETYVQSFLRSFYDQFYKDSYIKGNEYSGGVRPGSYHNQDVACDSKYQDEVFNKLHSYKASHTSNFSESDLIKLQSEIESLTTQFDDLKNRFQIVPDLLHLLIDKNKTSAREFLKSQNIPDSDKVLLSYLDPYTIEGIIVYVLGLLFNSIQESPAVRVSTLVEYLSRFVVNHALMMQDREVHIKEDEDNYRALARAKEYASLNLEQNEAQKHLEDIRLSTLKEERERLRNLGLDNKYKEHYNIGSLLVEFLVSRKLIILSTDLGLSDIYVSKKKGKYYYPKKLFAICNFNIGLLPVKLNLPMVCKPVEWKIRPNIK